MQKITAHLLCAGFRRVFLLLALLAGLLFWSTGASATCIYSGSTSGTYTYTAATITSAAAITLTGSITCNENGSVGTSPYICIRTVFTGNTNSINSTSLSYTTSASTGGATTGTKATSGTWYGTSNTVSSSNALSSSVTVTAPATSTYYPAGTYTTTVALSLDMQRTSGSCNADTTGWDSGIFTLTFNWVVPSICSLVSTSNIDFGSISDVGQTLKNYDATGAVAAKCNYGAAYTLYLGDGNSRLSGSYRRMAYGSYLLPYQLYQDSSYATVWDSTGGTSVTGGSGGISSTGTGANQTFTVYGRIPKGLTIPSNVGTYSDTVVVTLTY